MSLSTALTARALDFFQCDPFLLKSESITPSVDQSSPSILSTLSSSAQLPTLCSKDFLSGDLGSNESVQTTGLHFELNLLLRILSQFGYQAPVVFTVWILLSDPEGQSELSRNWTQCPGLVDSCFWVSFSVVKTGLHFPHQTESWLAELSGRPPEHHSSRPVLQLISQYRLLLFLSDYLCLLVYHFILEII